MFRRFSLGLAALIAILSLFPSPGSTADDLNFHNEWMLRPESSENHPQHKVITLVAQQNVKLVACNVSYSHHRNRYVTSLGESVNVKQPKGGSAAVTLELITRAGRRELGRWNLKRKSSVVGMNLVDPSGLQEPEFAWPTTAHLGALPLKLKKNEALLFIFDFSNTPRVLGVKRSGGEIQYDTIRISGSCSTCGSKDTPCPGSE